MINLFLLLLAIPGLVLLYFQWRVTAQQKELIKAESESLRQLRKKNNTYVDTGLFGLQSKSSYLKSSAPKPDLPEHRIKIMSRHLRKSRKNDRILQN